MKIGVVMTNWNGRNLLEVTIPRVIEAAEFDQENRYEIVVVDDISSDDSVDFLKNNYSHKVRVVSPSKNLGFQGAVNFGVERVNCDIVIVMNNDIYPARDAFLHLTKHFSEENNVFAVTGRFYEWDEKTYLYGNRGGVFKWGHLWLYEKDFSDTKSQTFFACGGAAAWRRDVFLSLGGFDTLYHPLYYEEIDISYRALKRGYKIVFEPDCIMYHKAQSTITRQHKRRKIGYISARNNYLFTWKNITDTDLFVKHLFFVPLFLIRDLFKLKFRFWISIFMALKRLGRVLKLRRIETKECIYSDKLVLDWINFK